MCNGLIIKWDKGEAACDHVLPIVAIFTGFYWRRCQKMYFLWLELNTCMWIPTLALGSRRNIMLFYLGLKKKIISILIGMMLLFCILTEDTYWRSIAKFLLTKKLNLMKSFTPKSLLTQTCRKLHSCFN